MRQFIIIYNNLINRHSVAGRTRTVARNNNNLINRHSVAGRTRTVARTVGSYHRHSVAGRSHYLVPLYKNEIGSTKQGTD